MHEAGTLAVGACYAVKHGLCDSHSYSGCTSASSQLHLWQMLAMSRQSHHANHMTMISNSRLIYSKMELALLQSSRAQIHLSVTAACIHITATYAEQNSSHTCNIMLPVSTHLCGLRMLMR